MLVCCIPSGQSRRNGRIKSGDQRAIKYFFFFFFFFRFKQIANLGRHVIGTRNFPTTVAPLLAELEASANAHDTDRHLAVFSKDLALMFIINGEIIRGWDALRERQRQWWNDGKATGVYEYLANRPVRCSARKSGYDAPDCGTGESAGRSGSRTPIGLHRAVEQAAGRMANYLRLRIQHKVVAGSKTRNPRADSGNLHVLQHDDRD